MRDIQRAYKEGFEASAKELLDDYLRNVEAFSAGKACTERGHAGNRDACQAYPTGAGRTSGGEIKFVLLESEVTGHRI